MRLLSSAIFRATLVAIAILAALPTWAQPQRGEPLPRKASLGAQLGPASAEETKAVGLQDGVGVKIVKALPGSTAESLKIQDGDVLVSFGGVKITGSPALTGRLRTLLAGEQVEAEVLRAGKMVTLKGAAVGRPKQKGDGYKVHYDQVVSRGKRIRFIVTYPEGKGPFPTLFMVGGIGAYSIDGEYAATAYGKVLEPIAKAGYAVIRMDKPGQGDSEGPIYTELLFDDELDAYLQTLKLAKTLEFVDKDRIALFGHSMGGAFAPLLAAEEPLAGIAVSGTVFKSWVEYQIENTRRQSVLAGGSMAEVDEEMKGMFAITHFLFNEGLSIDEVKKQKPDLAPLLSAMSPDGKTFSGVGIPFFQQLAKKNLPSMWAKVDAPVLALHGENDFISTRSDHEMLAQAMNAKKAGLGEFISVPKSDHGFFVTESERDSMTKWGRPTPFNENIVDILKTWLAKVLKK